MTGGSGFLGRALAEALDVRSERADLLDPESLFRVVSGNKLVIHLAATTHTREPRKYKSINVDGTRNLIEASQKAGIEHFIYVSTTALGDKCGAYGASKLDAENLVKKSGLPFTIIRPAEVYGGESQEGIGVIIKLVKRFHLAPYIKGAKLAPVHVADVVEALIKAIALPPRNQTYILAGPKTYSFREAVRIIAQTFNKKVLSFPLPEALARFGVGAPDQVARLLCVKDYDNTFARLELSFAPRNFEEGLLQPFVKTG